jgi:protein TonB
VLTPATPTEARAAAHTATSAPALAASDAPLVPPAFDAAYLHNPKPRYPRAAVRMGLEGEVRIEVLVGVDGKPQELRLARSSGHAVLDEAAMETVTTWRFVPARRGAEAIAARVQVPIRFRLDQE